MAAAYYNEHDKFAAAWLRQLIKCGVIAPGEIDERDIQQVTANDIRGFTQCHFFAGIGVWSYALRQAGWPDAERVWTGSCPCQPFSVSGARKAAQDERHLWPRWFPLIRECRPGVIFGEQVASDDGLAWLDVVSSDLENEDYAIGAVDTCAAGFGAPQISQRLFFVAQTERRGFQEPEIPVRSLRQNETEIEQRRTLDGMAAPRNAQRRTDPIGPNNNHATQTEWSESPGGAGKCSVVGELGKAADQRREGITGCGTNGARCPPRESRPSNVNGFWADAEWITCRDGKARPVEPGTFPLAYGAPARVGRLRGYGNALVAPQAIEFVMAYLEISKD